MGQNKNFSPSSTQGPLQQNENKGGRKQGDAPSIPLAKQKM